MNKKVFFTILLISLVISTQGALTALTQKCFVKEGGCTAGVAGGTCTGGTGFPLTTISACLLGGSSGALESATLGCAKASTSGGCQVTLQAVTTANSGYALGVISLTAANCVSCGNDNPFILEGAAAYDATKTTYQILTAGATDGITAGANYLGEITLRYIKNILLAATHATANQVLKTTNAAAGAVSTTLTGFKSKINIVDVQVLFSATLLMTLVRSNGIVNICGGNFQALPAADGFVVSTGLSTATSQSTYAQAVAGAYVATPVETSFAIVAVSNSFNDPQTVAAVAVGVPSFNTAVVGATAVTGSLFALSGGAQLYTNQANFGGLTTFVNTGFTLVNLQSAAADVGVTAAYFTATNFIGNSNANPIILGNNAKVGFNNVTFTSNKNTLAVGTTDTTTAVMTAPISLFNTWLVAQNSTFTSNVGFNGGVISLLITTASNGNAAMNAATDFPAGFVLAATGTASTTTTNVFTTCIFNSNTAAATGQGGAVLIQAPAKHLVYTVKVVDETSVVAGGVWKVLGATFNDMNMVGTTVKSNLVLLDQYSVGALVSMTNVPLSLSSSTNKFWYWNNVASNVTLDGTNKATIPDIKWNFADIFGNAYGAAQAGAANPGAFLYNPDTDKSYYFGFSDLATTVSPNTVAGRRILAPTDVGSTAVGLDTTVTAALKADTDFLTLAVQTDATKKLPCFANRTWFLQTKGTWTQATMNTFTLKNVAVDSSTTVWFWLFQSTHQSVYTAAVLAVTASAPKFSKNWLVGKVQTASGPIAASANGVVYFVVPMVMVDKSCPSAPNLVCKVNEFLDTKAQACTACHASCGTCSGASTGSCLSCADAKIFVVNGACTACTAPAVSTLLGCKSTTDINTALTGFKTVTGTMSSTDTLNQASNFQAYVQSVATVSVLADPNFPCVPLASAPATATSQACTATSNGACTANVCVCTSGFSGRFCQYTKADGDLLAAVNTNIVAGVSAALNTATTGGAKLSSSQSLSFSDQLAQTVANPDSLSAASLTSVTTALTTLISSGKFDTAASKNQVLNAVGLAMVAANSGTAMVTADSATRLAQQKLLNTQLDTLTTNLVASSAAVLAASKGTQTVSGTGLSMALQGVDTTKAVVGTNGATTFTMPSSYTTAAAALTTPVSVTGVRNFNPYQLIANTTLYSNVQSFTMYSNGAVSPVTATTLGAGNFVNVVLSTGGSAKQACAYWDATSSTWKTTDTTGAATATTLACTVSHLTDFAAIPQVVPVKPTNSIKIIMNFAIALLAAFFALMF